MGRITFLHRAINHISRYKIFYAVPDAIYLKIKYWARMAEPLHLDHPVTFNEKLQWLKLHDRKAIYTTMVDKYAVKDYVAEKLGSQYIIPTLGVWDKFDDIDFDPLPDQFVLKCTHDSGGVVICKDKNHFDKESAREKINNSLKKNYYFAGREWPYKNVKPRIIAEKYLENDKNEGLHDYKVWCLNGEPLYIQYVSGRIGDKTYEIFYDKDWNPQPFRYHNLPYEGMVSKPEKLDEMLISSRNLAAQTAFTRCDFYVLADGSLKFGEITFFPNSGYESFDPKEWDYRLGEWLQLDGGGID